MSPRARTVIDWAIAIAAVVIVGLIAAGGV